MDKRGEITPRTIIISFGFFTLVMMAGFWVVGLSFTENTGAFDNTTLTGYEGSFVKFAEYQTQIESQQANIEAVSGEEGAFGFLNSLINQGWQTVKLLGSSFGFIPDVISVLSDSVGVPVWVGGVFSLMLIAIFSLVVLSVIFQRTT